VKKCVQEIPIIVCSRNASFHETMRGRNLHRYLNRVFVGRRHAHVIGFRKGLNRSSSALGRFVCSTSKADFRKV